MKPFACDQCDFASRKKNSLNQHINAVHLKLKPFKCNLCGVSFTEKRSMERHIDAIHLKLRPFTCDQCDFTSSYKGGLNRHIEARVFFNHARKFIVLYGGVDNSVCFFNERQSQDSIYRHSIQRASGHQ